MKTTNPTTTTTATATATATENKKSVICLCCLSVFPVIYLIGSFVVSLF
jgi:hypothetical protein